MEVNEFYQAAADHMTVQINYLQELIGRSLSPDELEHLHEFYETLDDGLKFDFESKLGPLV